MRNKAQPHLMMKGITGSKAHYASYDNHKIASENADTEQAAAVFLQTAQKVISPERPSSMTF